MGKFGVTVDEADAVFFLLDVNLDNRIEESEFRHGWESAVNQVCPTKLSSKMTSELAASSQFSTARMNIMNKMNNQ